MQNTQANIAELDETYRLFQLINALLNTLSLLFVVLPIGRTVRGSVVALRAAVGAREQAIQVQQAANQRTYQILQREAANAAAFRMRAGE